MEDELVLATILSLILPGLGQLIKGEYAKGIAFMVGFVVSLVIGAILLIILVGPIIPLGVWLLSIVDAATE